MLFKSFRIIKLALKDLKSYPKLFLLLFSVFYNTKELQIRAGLIFATLIFLFCVKVVVS